MTSVDEDTITVKLDNATYSIKESGKVIRAGKEGEKEMTVAEMRDNNRLVLMTTNPRYRTHMAGVLESIALVAENYDMIANMDNAAIYMTKNDKFVVIESGNNLFATLLASNRCAKWSINENAVDALSFIKSKTNVSLGEKYNDLVAEHIEKVSEEEKDKIEQELKENERNSYRERIAALTEKFKNDPTKLAVLSQLAAQITDAEYWIETNPFSEWLETKTKACITKAYS